MISLTPEERIQYDARRKAQLDAQWMLEVTAEQALERGIEQGIEQGLEQGIERGSIIGRIQLLQQILKLPQTSISELREYDLNQLRARMNQLQQHFDNRDPI